MWQIVPTAQHPKQPEIMPEVLEASVLCVGENERDMDRKETTLIR
jgi:hypothetical protein